MKALKPAYFGHRECAGKEAEAKEATRVSTPAKCAISAICYLADSAALFSFLHYSMFPSPQRPLVFGVHPQSASHKALGATVYRSR
jgi:hypothetical protein